MICTKTKAASGVRSGNGGRVAERENRVERFATKRLHGGGGGFFGIRKTHGNCLVAPGIGEFVTAISDVGELDAEFARGGCKAAGLIAEL